MNKKIVKVEFVVNDENYSNYEKAIGDFEKTLEGVGAKSFSVVELNAD